MRFSRLLALARQLGGSPAVTDALQQPAWITAALGLAVKPFTSGPSSLQRSSWRPQQSADGGYSAAAASSLAVGALPPPAAAAQLQPSRRFAAASGRPAALRRLKRASARAAVGVGSRGSGGKEAALARQEAGGGEIEAGPSHDVVVHEGPANSLQIASVVDHPALIVTRPIEWCAGCAAGLRCATKLLACRCRSVAAFRGCPVLVPYCNSVLHRDSILHGAPPCRSTVLLGYEQANRYQVIDQHGERLFATNCPVEVAIGCEQANRYQVFRPAR